MSIANIGEITDAIATHLEGELYVEKEFREADYSVIRCTDDAGNEYVIKVIQMNAVEKDDDEDGFDDCLFD